MGTFQVGYKVGRLSGNWYLVWPSNSVLMAHKKDCHASVTTNSNNLDVLFTHIGFSTIMVTIKYHFYLSKSLTIYSEVSKE